MRSEQEIRDKLDRMNDLLVLSRYRDDKSNEVEKMKDYVIDLLALLIGKDTVETPEVRAWFNHEPSALDSL